MNKKYIKILSDICFKLLSMSAQPEEKNVNHYSWLE